MLFVYVERRNLNCVHLGTHLTAHSAAPWTLQLEAADHSPPLATLLYGVTY